MTRAHARLLGPCFKTGPESTQSNSVVDKRVLDTVREIRRKQSSGSGVGTRSERQITVRAFDAPNANVSRSSAMYKPSGESTGSPWVRTGEPLYGLHHGP